MARAIRRQQPRQGASWEKERGPGPPVDHGLQHTASDRGDGLPRHVHAVKSGQMRLHLVGGQSLGHQRDHLVIDAADPALPLGDDLRLEAGLPVPGRLSPARPHISKHCLGPVPIAGFPLLRPTVEYLRNLSTRLLQYPLDLAAVNVKFAGDGALTVARLVPRADGLLQRWRNRHFQRCFVRQRRYSLVPRLAPASRARLPRPVRISIISSSNEPTSARAGHTLTSAPTGPWPWPRPCARLAPTVATMPVPQAPGGQPWYWLAPAAGVQYHHGRGPDPPVHCERQQSRRQTGLSMQAHRPRPGRVLHRGPALGGIIEL